MAHPPDPPPPPPHGRPESSRDATDGAFDSKDSNGELFHGSVLYEPEFEQVAAEGFKHPQFGRLPHGPSWQGNAGRHDTTGQHGNAGQHNNTPQQESTPLLRGSALSANPGGPARPAPRRRRALWLGTGVAAIGALIAYGVIADPFAGLEPDAKPSAVPTQPVPEVSPDPRPELTQAKPITISDPEIFLTEPTRAWRLGALPGISKPLRLVDRTPDGKPNTSGVVVLAEPQRDSDHDWDVSTFEAPTDAIATLIGIDSHTGDVLWRTKFNNASTRCQILAQGHQVGCISAGLTRSNVDVLDARTGSSHGPLTWEIPCMVTDLLGDANSLLIAGETLTGANACLARGPVWARQPRASLTPELRSEEESLGPENTLLTAIGDHVTYENNDLLIVDSDLGGYAPLRNEYEDDGSTIFYDVEPVFGPYRIEVQLTDSETSSGSDKNDELGASDGSEHHPDRVPSEFFYATTYLDPRYPALTGLSGQPWVREELRMEGDEHAQILGVGSQALAPDGTVLWQLEKDLPQTDFSYAVIAPSFVLAVQVTYLQNLTREGDDPGDLEFNVVTTYSAQESLTGKELWSLETHDDLDSDVKVVGHTLIRGNPKLHGPSAVEAVDARTGAPVWSIRSEAKEDSPRDSPQVEIVGDVLVHAGEGVVTGYAF